jgi:hypothetical protein
MAPGAAVNEVSTAQHRGHRTARPSHVRLPGSFLRIVAGRSGRPRSSERVSRRLCFENCGSPSALPVSRRAYAATRTRKHCSQWYTIDPPTASQLRTSRRPASRSRGCRRRVTHFDVTVGTRLMLFIYATFPPHLRCRLCRMPPTSFAIRVIPRRFRHAGLRQGRANGPERPLWRAGVDLLNDSNGRCPAVGAFGPKDRSPPLAAVAGPRVRPRGREGGRRATSQSSRWFV